MPVLRYSYCVWLQSSLSLYQCTLLPICTVATVQLLYTIPIPIPRIALPFTISRAVSALTNLTLYSFSYRCQPVALYQLLVRCNKYSYLICAALRTATSYCVQNVGLPIFKSMLWMNRVHTIGSHTHTHTNTHARASTHIHTHAQRTHSHTHTHIYIYIYTHTQDTTINTATMSISPLIDGVNVAIN